jgi:nitrile hydratase
MGGVSGFGPINPEPERSEPLFHEPWERRALGLTLACGMLGRWTIDMARHARERQDRERYLGNSYYETWIAGLETLLTESGLMTPAELQNGKASSAAKPVAIHVERAIEILGSGSPTLMDGSAERLFQVGDKVRVIDEQLVTHTRAPRYAHGHVGVVEAYHGLHVFADAHALRPDEGGGRRGEPLYSVRFTALELWGNDANPGDSVLIDLWQPYLESR